MLLAIMRYFLLSDSRKQCIHIPGEQSVYIYMRRTSVANPGQLNVNDGERVIRALGRNLLTCDAGLQYLDIPTRRSVRPRGTGNALPRCL